MWQVYEIARRDHPIEEASLYLGLVGLCQFLPLLAFTLPANAKEPTITPFDPAVSNSYSHSSGGITVFDSLGVSHIRLGTEDKRPAAEALLAELGLDWRQAAAMGDDWPDLPVMTRVALACAPPHAHAEARAVAHHVTHAQAGQGAARELCDLILIANGHYARLLQAQLDAGAAGEKAPA